MDSIRCIAECRLSTAPNVEYRFITSEIRVCIVSLPECSVEHQCIVGPVHTYIIIVDAAAVEPFRKLPLLQRAGTFSFYPRNVQYILLTITLYSAVHITVLYIHIYIRTYDVCVYYRRTANALFSYDAFLIYKHNNTLDVPFALLYITTTTHTPWNISRIYVRLSC